MSAQTSTKVYCSGVGSEQAILQHLEEGEGLEVDLVVASWVAWLAHIADHNGHSPLVGVGVAVANLHQPIFC